MNIEKLKYPIGKFNRPVNITKKNIDDYINSIEKFPSEISMAVKGLSKKQLHLRYRPDGWTIQQVVHHCADSHLNSIIRFKLALTEENPVIKPYREGEWAKLSDMEAPVEWSLQLLEGLHNKWVFLLRSLAAEQLKRTYFHPEHNRAIPLDETMALYAWHCEHHLAHIEMAKNRE